MSYLTKQVYYLSMQVCVASTVSMAGRPSVSESVMLSIESRLRVCDILSCCPTGDNLARFKIVNVRGEPEVRVGIS